MSSEYIYGFFYFVPLDVNAPKFFGFSEFLAALALMVLAWTIADVRYQFRIRTAPINLEAITFFVVGTVGFLTLLTDLWRAEQWLVPRGNIISPAGWQAFLGWLFLQTFLMWAWFAFIRPPVYSKRNAGRFGKTLYQYILNGSPSELSVISDELAKSAKHLIGYATNRDIANNSTIMTDNEKLLPKPSMVTVIADDVLRLIADKRFCRAIIESSSRTALKLFEEVSNSKKYGVQIDVFAKNIVSEALSNRDSFLYHETAGYESGFMGYYKPFSNTIFSDYRMVESIGTLLDLDWKKKLDAAQWEAYYRVVLITFQNYIDQEFWSHSFTLCRAFGYIKEAVSDLYGINGAQAGAGDNDIQAKLRIVVNFINDAIAVLEKKGVPEYLQLRVQKIDKTNTFYDHIARIIFEIIFAASAVKTPAEESWGIQYVSIWSRLFILESGGNAAKVVNFKVRRLLYDEIAEMNRFPNFKGARILSYCLNVMGFAIREKDYRPHSIALQKAVLSWTKKNFVWLHSYHPEIAEECLVDGITYDEKNQRLLKTYPVNALSRLPKYSYFNLNPLSHTNGG